MDQKKLNWLKTIGAVEKLWEHCRWYVPDTDMHYSEEYIKNTPLEILEAEHIKNINFIKTGKGVL